MSKRRKMGNGQSPPLEAVPPTIMVVVALTQEAANRAALLMPRSKPTCTRNGLPVWIFLGFGPELGVRSPGDGLFLLHMKTPNPYTMENVQKEIESRIAEKPTKDDGEAVFFEAGPAMPLPDNFDLTTRAISLDRARERERDITLDEGTRYWFRKRIWMVEHDWWPVIVCRKCGIMPLTVEEVPVGHIVLPEGKCLRCGGQAQSGYSTAFSREEMTRNAGKHSFGRTD